MYTFMCIHICIYIYKYRTGCGKHVLAEGRVDAGPGEAARHRAPLFLHLPRDITKHYVITKYTVLWSTPTTLSSEAWALMAEQQDYLT